MAVSQQRKTIAPGPALTGDRDAKVREAQVPVPLAIYCNCVQSPCPCTQNGINASAYSAVSGPATAPMPEKKTAEPSLVDKALNEIGEVYDATKDAVGSFFSGGVETVTKPIVDAGKSAFGEVKGFISGLDDTIRFGLIAIAIALVVAILLGLVFLRR